MAIEPFAAGSPLRCEHFSQLLFEAGLLDKLVELALSDAGLPGGTDELQAQEIARTRARFALRAMLREQRNAEAGAASCQGRRHVVWSFAQDETVPDACGRLRGS